MIMGMRFGEAHIGKSLHNHGLALTQLIKKYFSWIAQ
jgi:hypothetical protein